MKLKWNGHSCFGMTFANGTTLVTDPFDGSMGYPMYTGSADIVTTSHDHFDHGHVEAISGSPVIVKTPGVHTINGITITGTHSFHDPEQGKLRGENVIFVIEADGLRIAHLGDLGHMPNAEQLAALADIDVMLIPIGGFFTITTAQAIEIIRATKPRCTIAMHYKNAWCDFPISDEKEFMETLGGTVLDNEIEITGDTILPNAAVMTFKA